MATSTSGSKIETLLGAKAESLLGFKNPKISKDLLHLPGPNFIDQVYGITDRNVRVLTNLQRMFGHGRLRNTGYLSILPVDQGIEHSAGASFAISSSSPSKANATPSRQHSACSARLRANTRTRFRSS
jgi:class I fructose-bisphosphate aldolase